MVTKRELRSSCLSLRHTNGDVVGQTVRSLALQILRSGTEKGMMNDSGLRYLIEKLSPTMARNLWGPELTEASRALLSADSLVRRGFRLQVLLALCAAGAEFDAEETVPAGVPVYCGGVRRRFDREKTFAFRAGSLIHRPCAQTGDRSQNSLERQRTSLGYTCQTWSYGISFLDDTYSLIGTQFAADAPFQLDHAAMHRYLPDLQAALNSLSAGGAGLLEWVTNVVRIVYLLEATPGRLETGASPQFAGGIRLSVPCWSAVVGEGLVHEASHQYFYILDLATPLAIGGDKGAAAVWSPLRQCLRPCWRVLLGFHAYLSILMYYTDILSRGDISDTPKEIVEERGNECVELLRETVKSLDGAGELMTSDGLAFYELMRAEFRAVSSRSSVVLRGAERTNSAVTPQL